MMYVEYMRGTDDSDADGMGYMLYGWQDWVKVDGVLW